jgi:hypothetical protein
MPNVTEVKYKKGYTIWIAFSNNKSGEIDLTKKLWGKVFEPLKDKKLFQQVQLNKELGTITWPNGADLAPEALYKEVENQ